MEHFFDDTICLDCQCRGCINPLCEHCNKCENGNGYIPYGCEDKESE